MRTEIPVERAVNIGGATEAPPKFQDIKLTVDESTQEVWVQNPPKPGRGRPSPYVQGLEFIVRGLSGLLEAALRDKAQLAQSLRRAQDTAADDARTARRENARLKVEKEELQERILEFEAAEAKHGREMAAKTQELSERDGQVRDAQAQVRLHDEQHQEALDELKKAHAEQLTALRAEQERETDQLGESHRQIVEAMEQDLKSVREELQALKDKYQELQESTQELQDSKDSLEESAQQSYALAKLIATVSVLVSPVKYVLFVDDEDQAVEDPTYVVYKDDGIEIARSKVLIHGQDLELEYKPGNPPVLTVSNTDSAVNDIVKQHIPLDDEGQPTIAGLALLHWLLAAAKNVMRQDELENWPFLYRQTFGEPDVEDIDETSEEDEETE